MERNAIRTERKTEKNRIRNIRKIKGFTLVELIVVVTILAILATVGFLALSGYSQDAKDSAIKANVRSLQTAITSEAAITNNSPRYYVVHDTDYALSGAFAYVDGASVALTGGDVGSAPLDSNYTAGKPDFKKLKLNPEKFRISSSGLPGGTLGIVAGSFGSDSAEASYDAGSLMAAGADFATAGANGKKRIVSYVQAAGISPATKLANVAGNFPSSDVPAGNVSGLLRAEPGSATNLTGALMDGGSAKATATGNQNAAVDENISNVVALMHFDGRTENGDASRNSVVFNASMEGTEGSDVLVDDAGATFVKTGTPVISTGTGKYGSSMYFNDSSYYTASAYSQDYSIAAGDFTVEAWIYNTMPASGHTNNYYTIAGTSNWIFYMNQSSVLSWTSQSIASVTWPTIPKNVWTHVAAVRSGTTVTIYVNWAASWSATVANGYTNATSFYVGTDPAGLAAREFRGYIDDLRITKGVARYSGPFTPEQIPAISGTPVPIDQKGAAITAAGNAKISNAQSKFWGGSAYFDGTGDYLSLAWSPGLWFWTWDFAVETWVNFTSLKNQNTVLDFRNSLWATPATLNVFWPSGAYPNSVSWYNGTSHLVTTWFTPTTNQWIHIAVARSGWTIKIFVNGEQAYAWTDSTNYNTWGSALLIGKWWDSSMEITGYLDELRITKGAGRYSSNFTVPTSAYPNP